MQDIKHTKLITMIENHAFFTNAAVIFDQKDCSESFLVV